MAASKRPRYDPSVAEATAKAKVSQAKQMESLTTEIVPAIVTAAKQLLGKGSKVSTETFRLAPKVAQILLVADIGLQKCMQLMYVTKKVPVNVPNRTKVVCSLMDPNYCIHEDRCRVYIDIIETCVDAPVFDNTHTSDSTLNHIPRYVIGIACMHVYN